MHLNNEKYKLFSQRRYVIFRYLSTFLLSCCMGSSLGYAGTAATDKPTSSNSSSAPQPVTSSEASTPSTRTKGLSPYQATYKAKIKGFKATVERSLVAKDDGLWELTNNASMFLASVKEVSLLSLNRQHISPLNYNYVNALSSKHDSDLQFDWKNLNARDSKQNNQTLTLTNNTYDKLSFQLQLRLDLQAQGSHFETRSYHIINRKKIKTYQVELLGEETIKTPAGAFKAVKLKQYRAGKDKYTLIWLAKDWDYLILRLERNDNDSGDAIELVKATLNGKALK